MILLEILKVLKIFESAALSTNTMINILLESYSVAKSTLVIITHTSKTFYNMTFNYSTRASIGREARLFNCTETRQMSRLAPSSMRENSLGMRLPRA